MAGLTAAMTISGVATAAPPAKCGLAKVAELPVTMRGRGPLVHVKIDGQDTALTADSGAFFSMLTPGAAQRLGLSTHPLPAGMEVRGAGRTINASVATAKTMEISGSTLRHVDFLVGGQPLATETDGLLGQNILGVLDVEYDLANGVIRLMKAEGDCRTASLAYWSKDMPLGMMTIEPQSPLEPALRGRASINDKSIEVSFDTGAAVTLIKEPAARRLGLATKDAPFKSGGVISGIGGGMDDSWIATIGSFEIGGEQVKNTQMTVTRLTGVGSDLIIGADFFLSHRVLVARSQHRLYFTYNGGPVFRLERPAAQQVAAADGAAEETLADAATYDRRGAAFLARREARRAIADFSKAVELEPKNPEHLVNRAYAYLGAGQPLLAMSDFDQALALKPDDLRALEGRGGLYLASHELTRAKADFSVALSHAPPDSMLPIEVAGAYAQAGDFTQSMTMYDAWIAAHGHDERLARALNGRCWARALSGRDLQLALDDCDAALRRATVAGFLDSRGLVHLRMGHWDKAIADYDAALKLRPDLSWSLYGRGLAKLAKGATADGQADIKAALAISPNIAKEAGRYGVTPVASAEPAAAQTAGGPG
ncbi:aspartyl protease family protein [Phenylobacterium soli]|nr:aspartyl protease family protein [Phenylobacterium soli]